MAVPDCMVCETIDPSLGPGSTLSQEHKQEVIFIAMALHKENITPWYSVHTI